MKHELKCWPEFFKVTWSGNKHFEIRWNDRNFETYDEVVLQEWDPKENDYTGREITGFIGYLTSHLQVEGFVVFEFIETSRQE